MSSSNTTGNAAGAAGIGGTGNTNNNSRRRWPARPAASSTAQILNRIPELEKAIFDIGPNAKPDQFHRSRQAIENYIQTTYKDPRDLVQAFRTLKTPSTLVAPTRPKRDPAKPDDYDCDFHDYKLAKEAYHARKEKFAAHEANAWGLVYGQCTAALRTELAGATNFEKCKDDFDVVTLLQLIEGLCSKLGDKAHSYYSVALSFKTLCMYYQPDHMSNDDYYQYFKSMVCAILKFFAGDDAIGHSPILAQAELEKMAADGGYLVSSATDDQRKEARDIAWEKFLAALFLSGANVKHYGALKAELANNYSMKIDTYPTTMEGVLSLLTSYMVVGVPSCPSAAQTRPSDAIEEQAMFAQGDDRELICNQCHQPGHIERNCPRRRNNRRAANTTNSPNNNVAATDEQVHAMVADTAPPSSAPTPSTTTDDSPEDYEEETVFTQNTGVVGTTKILLDNQSTINQFASKALLSDIRPADRPVRVFCNAGSTVTNLQGDFGSIPVFFDENGTANILSLKEVASRHRVTYDSWDHGGVFVVHMPTGVIEFNPTEKGLHELDLAEVSPTDVATMLVTTVAENYEGFTKREVLKAHEARRLQRMLGCPSDRDFQGMVREKLIANCPVTITDVQNAYQILGPDLAGLRGKTVRRKPEHVAVDYVAVPRDFLDRHRNVTVTADLMFVNGLPFLITQSRGINLVTIEFASTRTAQNLSKLVSRVITTNAVAGFKVQTIMMDMEFQPLQELLPNVVVNTTAANEHVAKIERRIRVVKERARAIINTLPYRRLPKRMVVKVMYFVTMWLNSFPVNNGISRKFSPRELLKRHALDATHHCRALFGAYCGVHDEHSPSNTMQRRTHAAICLGPTGNIQGSYKFFCLTTGRKIVR